MGIAIVAASFSNGSYGGVATGLGAAAVWAVVVCVVLSRRAEAAPLRRSFVVAAAALAAIALISALSLRWSADAGSGFTESSARPATWGCSCSSGCSRGRARAGLLTGIGAGLVAVCLVAIGSRLLALGPGDADLVSTFPSSAGRLSYPTGYWNALGAMAAMAVPVLVWLATEVRRRPLLGIVLAASFRSCSSPT